MKKTVSKKSISRKSTVAKKSPAKKSSTPAKKTSTKRSSPVAPVKQPTGGKTAARAAQPLRFAHPFFTPTPLSHRTVVPGVGTRLLDYIQGNLEPIPAPTRTPLFTLADIIGQPGAQQIQASGSIRFHTCGDTGRGANSPQGVVAEAMTTDYDTAHPETSPASSSISATLSMASTRTSNTALSSMSLTSTIRVRSSASPVTTMARSSPRLTRPPSERSSPTSVLPRRSFPPSPARSSAKR